MKFQLNLYAILLNFVTYFWLTYIIYILLSHIVKRYEKSISR